MNLKKKISVAVSIVIALWLLCPLPEISIIFSILVGKSLTSFFGLPSYVIWIGVVLSVPLGWFVFDRLDLDIIDRFRSIGFFSS